MNNEQIVVQLINLKKKNSQHIQDSLMTDQYAVAQTIESHSLYENVY